MRLTADLSEDVAGGLLEKPVVNAYDKKNNDVFSIPAHSQKAFYVNFIGGFGGRNVKQNRLLPDIQIWEVSDGSSERRYNNDSD